MGWEQRARGGPYYIRRTTSNGREIREYVGRGASAERAAAEDAAKRANRERERAEWKHLEVLDLQITELDTITNQLMRASFLASGLHQHHRGEWRKHRHEKKHGRHRNLETAIPERL